MELEIIKYIKMCDCPEVQEQWKPKFCDAFCKRSDGIVVHYLCNVEEWEPRAQDLKFYVWLPHQGQIQEMMPQCNCAICLTEEFYRFFENNLDGLCDAGIETLEQMWLAFYMHEKHNKVWDGEKWVKGK